jgi:hypothetical protein
MPRTDDISFYDGWFQTAQTLEATGSLNAKLEPAGDTFPGASDTMQHTIIAS